jgi:hypothetical protein
MDRITMSFMGDDEHNVEVSLTGDGCIDHYVEAFRGFLMASGYPPRMVSDLLGDVDVDINANFHQRDEEEEFERLKAFDQRMGSR